MDTHFLNKKTVITAHRRNRIGLQWWGDNCFLDVCLSKNDGCSVNKYSHPYTHTPSPLLWTIPHFDLHSTMYKIGTKKLRRSLSTFGTGMRLYPFLNHNGFFCPYFWSKSCSSSFRLNGDQWWAIFTSSHRLSRREEWPALTHSGSWFWISPV